MKLTWHKLKLIILAGTIPPIYFNIKTQINTGASKLYTPNNFFPWLFLSIGVTVIVAIIVFKEITWLEKKLPWKKYPKFRIGAEFLLTTSTVLLAMYAMSFFTYDMHVQWCQCDTTFQEHVFEEFSVGLVMLLLILSITEGAYFFQEWKNSLVLSEKLQKEKVESQLEALRNQANPHFLFNSLNVLSSLVHSDPDKAEEFINQFANVYRYVLNISEKNVVTLNEELDFLNAYIFLQKIRFKDGFECNIKIDDEHQNYYIAPFSLQMLVENAIKHNIVSKENPLQVDLYIEGSKIYVSNNIQPRDDDGSSNGVGLSNLRQRYFHLAGIMPEVTPNDKEFIVSIPLLKPEKKDDSIKYNHDECCYNRRRKSRS